MRLLCGGGTALGAIGGFLVGGPIGAFIGAGLGATYDQGQAQAKATKKATQATTEAANKQAAQAEREFNKANAKTPNVGALDAANGTAAQSGVGSTMLTGAGGVDPTALALSQTTLLGK